MMRISRSLTPRLIAILALLPAAAPWTVCAATEITATKIVLGTATQGGGFQLFGQNLAEVINTGDADLKIDAIATRGGKQNLSLLEEAKIDIGLVEGNAAREALEGIGRPRIELMVLSVMYPNPGMFVVRGDTGYRRIEDLLGKPIAFGTRASGLRILAKDVLDGLGLAPERDFEQVILEKASQGPKLVLDGSVAALWGAGIGWPASSRWPTARPARASSPPPPLRSRRSSPHIRSFGP
jgi:TRAP transporter TAXI family solute receptor